MLTLDEIIAACGYITATNSLGMPLTGTGYLIAPNLVATCGHVVKDVVPEAISISFDGTIRTSKSLSVNTKTDCAVIELDAPLSGVTPLRIGGPCVWKATWDSYGFPAAAKGAGVTMSGIVSNPKAKDDLHAEVLELTSPEVAAGMATPLHGFSGSPVIVDGFVVGHLKRFLADTDKPDHPAFGKVWATRAACVHGLLAGGDTMQAEPLPVGPPQADTPAYKTHLDKVRSLLAQWSSHEEMPPGQAGLVAAESLIQLGVPNEAINVLTNVPQTIEKKLVVRKDQLLALALAKTAQPENIEKAVDILEKLRADGNFDAETGGLLGGRFKQLWLHYRNQTDLERSHKMYLDTFDTSSDPYPGINAAATALWLGKKDESERIASKVLAHIDAKTPGSMDYWDLATKAEALTLTGNITEAKEWYQKAAQRCDYAPESINTMRSQAIKNIDSMGINADVLGDVFE